MDPTILLWVVAVIFIGTEWNHRAKRDGKKEATKAMLLGAGVFGVGLVLQKYFGLQGLLILLLALMLIIMTIVAYRTRNTK